MSKALYLIERGPKPEYQKAPFHPVIICDREKVARWETDGSDKQATVWVHTGWHQDGAGWLLIRWKGFDLDYGGVVRVLDTEALGKIGGFWRDYESEHSLHAIINRAVWWSFRAPPQWLADRGVVQPTDDFSLRMIDDCFTEGMQPWKRPVTIEMAAPEIGVFLDWWEEHPTATREEIGYQLAAFVGRNSLAIPTPLG